MNLWRYTAIVIDNPAASRSGELAADSAADLRASLRRAGLQVVHLKPVRRPFHFKKNALSPLIDRLEKHLRTRRRVQRAELYDSLATMLESGLALTDAVETLLESRRRKHSALQTLLSDFRGRLREGSALSEAMNFRGDWFDAAEVAMVTVAQQSGELAHVLRSLATRQQRAEALSQKLLGALAYPAVVSVIALAVVVFMSTHTLPQLAALLETNDISVPRLTQIVMSFGQWFARHWLLVFLALLTAPAIAAIANAFVNKRLNQESRFLALIPCPELLRQLAVGGFCGRLAELLRAGIPLVESLHVVAPTISKPQFRAYVLHAAELIEHGGEPAHALGHKRWLDAEFVRLIELGQHTGALDTMLERLADRYQRSAERSIDRLTRLLEPLVIVILAAVVGIVVMAAVLPLVRLQEII